MADEQPYKLAGWHATAQRTIVSVGDVLIGGEHVVVMAGTLIGTSHSDIRRIAEVLSRAGISIFSGEGYRPDDVTDAAYRLMQTDIEVLHDVRERFKQPLMLEATSLPSFERIESAADVLLVAARNMHNFGLLRQVGQTRKPVVLQRSSAATLSEFLFAAEYILAEGNPHVILCERGIRTFARHAPATLDLAAVPSLRQQSHLPIIVDPSYSVSTTDALYALACASIAVGADGIMIGIQLAGAHQRMDMMPTLALEQLHLLTENMQQIAQICSVRRPPVVEVERATSAMLSSVAQHTSRVPLCDQDLEV